MSGPEFAHAVRELMQATAGAGMRSPAFKSPPRLATAERTIRWVAPDRAIVAVRRANRASDAVLADMIEGVVRANRLSGTEAQDAARKLAACLTR
jgi:hypothetical protein